MNKANKVKLGAFVLLSVILLVIGFIATGVTKIFTPKVHAMTVINTSVEGLSAGSPVKYLGLPVGTIKRIAMREDDGYIAVYFDLSPSAMDGLNANQPFMSSASNLAEILKKRNPACFVNAAGLMGGAYLELTLGSADEPPALPHLTDVPSDILYIQSRPSHIGNAIQNVSRVIDELSKVNLLQLADKLNQTLDNINAIVSRNDLQEMLTQFHKVSGDLQQSTENLRLILSEANIAKVNRSLDNIELSSRNLQSITSQSELGDLIKNLNAFLLEGRATMQNVDRFGANLTKESVAMRLRLETSLTRLENLSRQLNDYMANLQQDPNQLVRGKQTPPLN